MWGGDPSLKISAPYLSRFGTEGVLKIFSQRMSDLIKRSMSNGGVCRTAPATPGLLISAGTIYTVKLAKGARLKNSWKVKRPVVPCQGLIRQLNQ